MNIDTNTVALAAIILGGAELRLAVSRLTSRVDVVEKKTLAHHMKKITPVLIWSFAMVSLCGTEQIIETVTTTTEVLQSGATGAAAGSAFGPVGIAIGAAVGMLVALRLGRWRKRKP